jgi:hypothetical protein
MPNYTIGPPSSPLTERAKGPIFTSNVKLNFTNHHPLWSSMQLYYLQNVHNLEAQGVSPHRGLDNQI